MARNGQGFPGMAIVFAVSGLTLVISGLRGRSIQDTLTALMEGRKLDGGPSLLGGTKSAGVSTGGVAGVIGGQSTLGDTVATTALSYDQVVPYKWGGHTPKGWDCSGFVSYVLNECGVDIPYKPHTTSAGFYVWRGAITVARSQCAPGDLVCWVGHIAIALDNKRMIHAPGKGKMTQTRSIYSVPAPIIRRPKAYIGGAS